MSATTRPKVLAIASAGGHWEQLRRLRPAWNNCTVTYVTTSSKRRKEIEDEAAGNNQEPPGFFVVAEASRWQKLKLFKQFFQIFKIILISKPDTIISTGAAPGYFAIFIGKLFRARTIWLDSLANVEELSLSGKKAGAYTDLWLTQWEHLAVNEDYGNSLRYEGKVI